MNETINFLKGIFQGDSLSVILFNLSVKTLSLKQRKAYAAGNETNINIIHNFFVDDLKLYAGTINNFIKLQDIATTFPKDIGMKFGVDKCAYIKINAGKQINSTVPLEMNNFIIKPVANDDDALHISQFRVFFSLFIATI